jgi:tetratricopeptide (TPR) repeat protein
VKAGDQFADGGNLSEALASYRSTLIVYYRAGSDALRERCFTRIKIAELLVKMGSLPEALEMYRACLPVATTLAGSDSRRRGITSFAHSQIGDVLKSQMKNEQALQEYRAAIEPATCARPSNLAAHHQTSSRCAHSPEPTAGD